MNNLDEYIVLKQKEKEIQHLLSLKKELAIEEALQLAEAGELERVRGKYKYGKYCFAIQNKVEKPQEPVIISKLKSLLEKEKTKAKMQNLLKITELQTQLNDIQIAIEYLSNTDEGREIQESIDTIMNGVEVEKKPQLLIYL